MDKASDTPHITAADAVLASGPWIVGEHYALREGLVDPAWPDRLVWWRSFPRDPIQGGSPEDGERLRRDPRLQRVKAVIDLTPDPRTRPPRIWTPALDGDVLRSVARLSRTGDFEILRWIEENGFVGLRSDVTRSRRYPAGWFETVDEIRYACGRLDQAWRLAQLLRRPKADGLLAGAEEILPGAGAGLAVEGAFEQYGGRLTGLDLGRRFGLHASSAELAAPTAEARLQVSYLLLEVLADRAFAGLLRVGVDGVSGEDGATLRLRPTIQATGPIATAYLELLEAVTWPAVMSRKGSKMRLVTWKAARPCEHCGEIYRPKRRIQRWCSKRCREANWHDAQGDREGPETGAPKRILGEVT